MKQHNSLTVGTWKWEAAWNSLRKDGYRPITTHKRGYATLHWYGTEESFKNALYAVKNDKKD